MISHPTNAASEATVVDEKKLGAALCYAHDTNFIHSYIPCTTDQRFVQKFNANEFNYYKKANAYLL